MLINGVRFYATVEPEEVGWKVSLMQASEDGHECVAHTSTWDKELAQAVALRWGSASEDEHVLLCEFMNMERVILV